MARNRPKPTLDEYLNKMAGVFGPEWAAVIGRFRDLAAHPAGSALLRARRRRLPPVRCGRAVWLRPWGAQLEAGLLLRESFMARALSRFGDRLPDSRYVRLADHMVRVAAAHAVLAAGAAGRPTEVGLKAADRLLSRLMLCGDAWRTAGSADGYYTWAERFLAVRVPAYRDKSGDPDGLLYMWHLHPFEAMAELFPDEMWEVFEPLFIAAPFARAAVAGRDVLRREDIIAGYANVLDALTLPPEVLLDLPPLGGIPDPFGSGLPRQPV